MKNTFKIMILSAAIGAGSGFAALPASAQLGLGVGIDTQIDLGVDARVQTRGEPYVYDGYESGHWHTRRDVHRRHQWDARYEGYDCYEAFQYTYERGERVRYDSTFCYDERDRPYERRNTRVVVRVD